MGDGPPERAGGEFLVTITNGLTGKVEHFNLASLIAMDRTSTLVYADAPFSKGRS